MTRMLTRFAFAGGLALAALAPMTVPSTAKAGDTYYQCNCDISNGPCTCSNHFEMGKFATRGFYGQCNQQDSFADNLYVNERGKHLTCATVLLGGFNREYKDRLVYRQCTNWKFKKDTVRIDVRCRQK
ncbi:MAG: hypothetical protein ACFB3T_00650 [Geminicoccaceae bacterium]